jgi:4-amino-4-deoxychorismate lyase
MDNQEFPFFESIRLENGCFHLLDLHEQRIRRSQQHTYGQYSATNLKHYLSNFEHPTTGLFKCRLRYGTAFERPEFSSYHPKSVSSLQMVIADELNYSLKYDDRSGIDFLFQQRDTCDDILIIRNGFVTDTSYCNIVFFNGKEWLTPAFPLLEGVQRSYLIQLGIIRPVQITHKDVAHFQSFKLINAMIPWDSTTERAISEIRFPID